MHNRGVAHCAQGWVVVEITLFSFSRADNMEDCIVWGFLFLCNFCLYDQHCKKLINIQLIADIWRPFNELISILVFVHKSVNLCATSDDTNVLGGTRGGKPGDSIEEITLVTSGPAAA